MDNTVIEDEANDGKIVFIGNKYFENVRTHHEPESWINLWFYKDRKKNKVYAQDVKCDYEITSKLEYKADTFYKLSQLSSGDNTFDYYYRLKSGLPTDIFKKNNRYKAPKVGQQIKPKRNSWKHSTDKIYDVNTDGKFVVSFE